MPEHDLSFGDTVRRLSEGATMFERYTLVRFLDRGGMGVVWQARDRELDVDIALKFLPEVVMHDPAALEDLRREARRSRELRHDNIVAIYDFVRDASTAAIAMELVRGATLSKLRLQRAEHVFGVRELEPMVAALCGALGYAHGVAKIVHRDIKPANLMLDTSGRLKVTDFGIARGITDSVSRVSRMASVDGSLPYMSPQQLAGENPGPSDDVYSIGATLYELLTGKPPFFSGGAAAITRQIETKVPPAMAERRVALGVEAERIPDRWEQVVARCLAKSEKDRPQSAAELARALGLGAEASDLGSPTPANPRTGSRAWYVGLGVLATAGIAAALYFNPAAPPRANAVPPPTAPPRPIASDEPVRARVVDATVRENAVREDAAHAEIARAIDQAADSLQLEQLPELERRVHSYLGSVPNRHRADVESRWDAVKARWRAALSSKLAESPLTPAVVQQLSAPGAAGAAGADGQDGEDGRMGRTSGDHGYAGEAGRAGENGGRGDDGGSMTLRVTAVGTLDGTPVVAINFGSAGDSPTYFHKLSDVMEFHFSGGDGGPGGRGGNGGTGGQGRLGRNGDNGGDGGDGGGGGRGGAGGDGGNGGTVRVFVRGPEEVVQLVRSLIVFNVSPGRGGPGGDGGSGGRGGEEGGGGSGPLYMDAYGRPRVDRGERGTPGSDGVDGDAGPSGSPGKAGTVEFL